MACGKKGRDYWETKDFAKPWFGWKKDGGVAIDLSDMTYEETVLRMVRLIMSRMRSDGSITH